MHMIFYHDAVRLLTCIWLWYGCYHFCVVKSFLIECSIRLKGSQMNDPISRGVTDGGVLSEIGMISLVQDE